MNKSIEEKKEWVENINPSAIQFGVGKEYTYLIDLKKGRCGTDKYLNIICLEFFIEDKERIRKEIKQLNDITNIHPDIKDYFNLPLNKQEVYL